MLGFLKTTGTFIQFLLKLFDNFQESFSRLSYEVLGDGSAPAFFRVNNDGLVVVGGELKTGSDIEYSVK